MSGRDRPHPQLTPRQEDIAYALPGHSYRQVGDMLGLSTRTVKYHVTNMRHRFGVSDRNELEQALREHNVIE